MTWYAQRGEDKKLVALLGDKSRGFYVDVGAWHPEQDSVTKHFYDRGWSGINIEPLPEYYRLLAAERPRDVNLNCALDDVGGGRIRMIMRVAVQGDAVLAGSGLTTFDERNAASALEREDHFEVTELPALVYTLAEICEEHVPPGIAIDFLKIDVEGWEERVIRGADWERWRPRILCIEATLPSSDIPAWEWEPLVLAAGYAFVDFDGLNRFYKDAR